jgi:archaellum biogenesis ATPase FlaH
MSNKAIEYTPSAGKQNQGISKQPKMNCTSNTKSIPSPFSWAKDFELSQEEVDEMADPEWIVPNLIISGHMVLLPAEPNGGKTTIMFHLAGQMANEGYDVFYVNTDISGGDAKPMVKQAKANGFTLMLPDMKVGKNMDSVLYELTEMNNKAQRYDNIIFIFDTLKKMVNVISKGAAKGLFELLRSLSAKGMTIVLLAHTNKYNGDDGLPIYEGTGDMRADVDDLIYLIPQKHDDKSMTVTTMPDKQRGTFEPISFKIGPNRNVSLLDKTIDTVLANKLSAEVKKDEVVITAINQAILNGSFIQKDIITHCSEHDGIGERAIKKALIKYTIDLDERIDAKVNIKIATQLWGKVKGGKNSSVFSIIESDP